MILSRHQHSKSLCRKRHHHSHSRVPGVLTLAVLGILMICPARAQTDTEFFRGKTLIIGIPSSAGGGYDAYGRLFGRYLAKHLPGNPNVIAQNVPGGAGLVLANSLFNTAPKDGTSIAIIRAGVLYEDIFGTNKAVRFDGRKFNWLGNLNSTHDTCVFWGKAGVNSPKDFYTRQHVLGADGVAGMDYAFPRTYNELLGTKFKIVTGYKGTPERILAMQRGEIEGACGMTTSLVKSRLRQQYRQGKIKIVVQAGFGKDRDFPDVPNIFDQAKTSEQQQVLKFLFAQLQLNRAIAAAPGVPKGRLQTLRAAFNAVVKDPAFLAEAKKQHMDINSGNSVETVQAVQRFYASQKSVVARARAILTPQRKK
jgi:tripartite-type tricarboxylate transporter receptor subunit TctC